MSMLPNLHRIWFGNSNLPPYIIRSLSQPSTLQLYQEIGIQPYHYVIDGRYHLQKNPLIFDENRSEHSGQRGYLKAMLNGLTCVQQ